MPLFSSYVIPAISIFAVSRIYNSFGYVGGFWILGQTEIWAAAGGGGDATMGSTWVEVASLLPNRSRQAVGGGQMKPEEEAMSCS